MTPSATSPSTNHKAKEAVVGAVVSTDPGFHKSLASMLNEAGGGIRFDALIGEPFHQIADPHIETLRKLAPDVIFVDLESDPQVGLKFAQYLVESELARAVVGAGPTDSPELILSAMQAGMVEYLPKPLEEDKVRSAMQRVRRRAGVRSGGGTKEEEATSGQTLCVFSAKGGSGATTFAVNLAVEVHRLSRKKTLLVDLDLELGETALLLGMQPKFSVVDLIRNFHRVDAGLLASYIEHDSSGVDLLSAPLQPVDFDSVDGAEVGQVLRFLKGHYDYIVIDAPKTLNTITLNAFETSDDIFILTTPDLPSIRNVSRCLPLLGEVGGADRDKGWVKVVVNRFSPRQIIPISEMEKTLGLEVFATLRNDYQSTMEAINEGRPVVFDRNSIYGHDVRKLASQITGISVSSAKDKGFLGGLFSKSRSG
ncbi:MAG: AAA family ATPase [Gemmatimonadota bacterium]